MRKISLILSTAALSLQNSGARAATEGLGAWTSQPLLAPHPALVAVLALVGMVYLLLMAHSPLGNAPSTWTNTWKWRGLPNFWPSRRATFALLAFVAITGSMSMA
jgi:hypothetical protein